MKLTARGKRVRAVVLLLLALFIVSQVSANLWYVGEGEGYCWGSYEKCYQVKGESK